MFFKLNRQSIQIAAVFALLSLVLWPRFSQAQSDDRPLLTAPEVGAPWVGVDAGQRLPVANGSRRGRAIGVVSADFNNNGLPDLATAWTNNQITLHSQTAFNEPFVESAETIQTPTSNHLITGDFNNDGNPDLLIATDNTLHLHPGKGDGTFSARLSQQLNSPITAIAGADLNRRNGLADFAVALENGDLLIFESPDGAWGSKAETFELEAPATKLAAGRLNSDTYFDLAVSTESDLFIVHGRDRKLAFQHDEIIPKATVSRLDFAGVVRDFAIGRFTPPAATDQIAILTKSGSIELFADDKATIISLEAPSRLSRRAELFVANLSPLPFDDLLVSDGAELHVLLNAVERDLTALHRHAPGSVEFSFSAETNAILPLRLNTDGINDLVLLTDSGPAILNSTAQSTITVNSSTDDSDGDTEDNVCDTGNSEDGFTGLCTLRAAIQHTNAKPGADTIVFGVGTSTIVGSLPTLLETVTVDGTGGGNTPGVAISGCCAEGNGFEIGPSVENSVLRGLAIGGFVSDGNLQGFGISINGNNNIIESNFIGTDINGTAANPNGNGGIGIGNIEVAIIARNNIIGGRTEAARNIISGNNFHGVQVGGLPGTSVQETRIEGNFIGTAPNGTTALPNGAVGILIGGGSNENFLHVIGGTAAGTRNLISGNAFGVAIQDNANNVLVQNNLIGSDLTGATALGNTSIGIALAETSENTIGGTAANSLNLISGNGINGIRIIGSVPAQFSNMPPHEMARTTDFASPTTSGEPFTKATNNDFGNHLVFGNHIGTTLDGTTAMANGEDGVFLAFETETTIGGTTEAARNIISGNGFSGVLIQFTESMSNTVQGNLIGVNINEEPLGNGFDGITISQSVANVIGGTQEGAGNLIAHNGIDGMLLTNGADSNRIEGNTIGVVTDNPPPPPTETPATLDFDTIRRTHAVRNAGNGISIVNSPNNIVNEQNVISGNSRAGVRIEGALANNNKVRGNVIGLDALGAQATPNQVGVLIADAPLNIIGGDQPNQGNTISGNQSGVIIIGDQAVGNKLFGNRIGTSKAGLTKIANENAGVLILSANDTEIGGTIDLSANPVCAGACNVISGNGTSGLVLGTLSGAMVRGNFIGLSIAGNQPLGNGQSGILMEGVTDSVIGGNGGLQNALDKIADFEGNVITGNVGDGITLSSSLEELPSHSNEIKGNLIGSDVLFSRNTQNEGNGVSVVGARDNEIRSNLIGGNIQNGVFISGTQATGNKLFDNVIGIRSVEPLVLRPNDAHGVLINETSNTRIGGFEEGEPNQIEDNGLDGIAITGSGTGNRIEANEITDNTGIGIDLGDDGVTANDEGDGDEGANQLQNTPVITAVVHERNGDSFIEGVLDSVPASTFDIQIYSVGTCDESGFGEGFKFLGHGEVTTGADGKVKWSVKMTENDQFFGNTGTAAAIATDADGSSSEFSACFAPLEVNSAEDDPDQTPGDGQCNTGQNNSEGEPECTLRAAIQEANALPSQQTIIFSIPDNGRNGTVIQLTTQLPDVTDRVQIDGSTSGFPQIILDGSGLPASTAAWTIKGDKSQLLSLTTQKFPSDGIRIEANDVFLDGFESLENKRHGVFSTGRSNRTLTVLQVKIKNNERHGLVHTGDLSLHPSNEFQSEISENGGFGVLNTGGGITAGDFEAIGNCQAGVFSTQDVKLLFSAEFSENGAGVESECVGGGLIIENGNLTVGEEFQFLRADQNDGIGIELRGAQNHAIVKNITVNRNEKEGIVINGDLLLDGDRNEVSNNKSVGIRLNKERGAGADAASLIGTNLIVQDNRGNGVVADFAKLVGARICDNLNFGMVIRSADIDLSVAKICDNGNSGLRFTGTFNGPTPHTGSFGLIQKSAISNNFGDGIHFEAAGNLKVTLSNIEGHGFQGCGVRQTNPLGSVDARFNWWGDPTGPGGRGPGEGDEVCGDLILFVPHLAEPVAFVGDFFNSQIFVPFGGEGKARVTFHNWMDMGATITVTRRISPGGVLEIETITNTIEVEDADVGATEVITVPVPKGDGGERFSTIRDFVRLEAVSANDSTLTTSATFEVIVADVADLSVTQSSDKLLVDSGDTVSFTVQVENNGPVTATNVVVTHTLPAELVFAGVAGRRIACVPQGQEVVCTVGDLGVGEAGNFVVEATANEAGVFNAKAEAGSDTKDVNLFNNDDVLAVFVEAVDLAVRVVNSAEWLPPSQPLTATIHVTNTGPSVATAVTLTQTLSLTSTLIQQIDSSQGNCVGAPVVCDLGAIAANESVTVTIVMLPVEEVWMVQEVDVSAEKPELNGFDNSAEALIIISNTPTVTTLSSFTTHHRSPIIKFLILVAFLFLLRATTTAIGSLHETPRP